MKRLAIWSVVALLSASAAQAQTSAGSPDTIYIHGNIYTGATLAPAAGGASPGLKAAILPRAQALAVRGDRLVAVGTDAEISKLKGKHTQVIDLGGHFVMPGFNDAHTHLASGGFVKLNVDLTGANSLDEMKSRIAARAKAAAPGEWIQGGGWDHTLWPGQKLPTRQDVDVVTGDHPALFERVDGHISLANTAALRAAEITRETPDPPGGKIDREASGEAAGILRESSAVNLVASKIPKPGPSQRRQAILLALQDAARWGITSAQDYSDWEDFLVYEDLEREGQLTLRISEWPPFPTALNVLEQHRAHHPESDTMLHTGMLKGFMDGSLGSRTATLIKPYSDDPQNTGLAQYTQTQLNSLIDDRAAAGFQVGFHAIGDRGIEMALQAFAEAERYLREHQTGMPNPRREDHRWRIEHAQVVATDQFARFRQLGVIASMQPNHLLTDMKWAVDRIGEERARHSYPWAEFLRNGVYLAFGTDYPVEPIAPFRGLYAAVTRKNEAGTKEYFPEQKLTMDEALAAYTSGAAYAEFAENDKGTLNPGKLADFVVLDRDLTGVAPAEVLTTRVLRTVIGGKTVFEAK